MAAAAGGQENRNNADRGVLPRKSAATAQYGPRRSHRHDPEPSEILCRTCCFPARSFSHGIWNRRQQRERRVVRSSAGGRPPGRKAPSLLRWLLSKVQVRCGCARWDRGRPPGPACSRGRPRRASHPSGSVGHENQHPHAGTAHRLTPTGAPPYLSLGRISSTHLNRVKNTIRRDLRLRPRARWSVRGGEHHPGALQRDLPPHQPKRGRPAETLFAVFVSRGNSQPRLAGVSGLDS